MLNSISSDNIAKCKGVRLFLSTRRPFPGKVYLTQVALMMSTLPIHKQQQ